jgi:predicted small lipoprotein YifL
MRFLLLFAAFGMLLALGTGCGQKGPLYLRDKPPPGMKPPKPPPVKPVPYPEEPQTENQ